MRSGFSSPGALMSLGAQGAPDLTVTLAKAGAQPEVPTRTNVAFVATIANIAAVQATNVLDPGHHAGGLHESVDDARSRVRHHLLHLRRHRELHAPTMPGNSQKTFRISSTAPNTITGQFQDLPSPR